MDHNRRQYMNCKENVYFYHFSSSTSMINEVNTRSMADPAIAKMCSKYKKSKFPEQAVSNL